MANNITNLEHGKPYLIVTPSQTIVKQDGITTTTGKVQMMATYYKDTWLPVSGSRSNALITQINQMARAAGIDSLTDPFTHVPKYGVIFNGKNDMEYMATIGHNGAFSSLQSTGPYRGDSPIQPGEVKNWESYFVRNQYSNGIHSNWYNWKLYELTNVIRIIGGDQSSLDQSVFGGAVAYGYINITSITLYQIIATETEYYPELDKYYRNGVSTKYTRNGISASSSVRQISTVSGLNLNMVAMFANIGSAYFYDAVRKDGFLPLQGAGLSNANRRGVNTPRFTKDRKASFIYSDSIINGSLVDAPDNHAPLTVVSDRGTLDNMILPSYNITAPASEYKQWRLDNMYRANDTVFNATNPRVTITEAGTALQFVNPAQTTYRVSTFLSWYPLFFATNVDVTLAAQFDSVPILAGRDIDQSLRSYAGGRYAFWEWNIKAYPFNDMVNVNLAGATFYELEPRVLTNTSDELATFVNVKGKVTYYTGTIAY